MAEKIRFNGRSYPAFGEPITEVTYWYDRHTRSWIIQECDADGNQQGAATYVGNGKTAALKVANEIADEHGVPLRAI